jgi:hypothetical protein
MVVYHVCSYKKLQKYIQNGYIKPPVRAWTNIVEAERFSKQTGRKIILRLKFTNYKKLDGHRGMAVYIDKPYKIDNI